jgi:uncharacterized membrane protein
MLADSGEYIALCSVAEVKLPWGSRFQQILSAGQITPTFHDTSSDFVGKTRSDRDRRAATGLVRMAGIVVVAGVAIAGMLMV